MITHFLGREQITAYARDLVARLEALPEPPRLWVALGFSGRKMVEALAEHLSPKWAAQLQVVEAACDRASHAVTFAYDLPSIEGPVFLLDSAIHSGGSMVAAAAALGEKGFRTIITYALVTKLSASFVPNFFGLIIGDHDRAYFQLESLPNNRLMHRSPFGIMRRLVPDDVHQPFIHTGMASIDKSDFGTLFYETLTQGTHVYVFELASQIVGFVSFELKPGGVLFLDLIANDKSVRGLGIGAALLRWAETWARQSNCARVELWSIDDQKVFYSSQGYTPRGDPVDLGDGETYQPMSKPILYHLSLRHSGVPGVFDEIVPVA